MKRSLPCARLRGRLNCERISEFSWACGLLLSVVLAGCAGSLDPGVGAGGSGGGNDCQTAILTSKCVACHGSASPAVGLDLQSADIPSRLLGIATGSGSSCPGGTLLDKGSNPATGVFIEKITMSAPTCGGTSMPFGTLLATADQMCLTSWATSLTATAAFSGPEAP